MGRWRYRYLLLPSYREINKSLDDPIRIDVNFEFAKNPCLTVMSNKGRSPIYADRDYYNV
jgi:hypothetical protein